MHIYKIFFKTIDSRKKGFYGSDVSRQTSFFTRITLSMWNCKYQINFQDSSIELFFVSRL